MSRERLGRLLGHRWWLVLLGSLIGLLAGLVFGRNWNSEVRPLYEAKASLVIDVGATESKPTNTEVEAALADAVGLALQANSEEFALDFRRETARVSMNINDSALTFVAHSRTNDDARARAGLMRATYLIAAGEALDTRAQLQSTLEAAKSVERELAEIASLEEVAALIQLFELTDGRDLLYRRAIQEGGKTPPPIPEQLLIQARIDVLNAIIDALNKQIGALAVDLATDPDDEDVIEEMAALEDSVNELLASIEEEETLLAVTAGEETTNPQSTGNPQQGETGTASGLDWRKAALEARQAELQTAYEGLFDMVESGKSVLPAVIVTNLTKATFPPEMAGLLGFLAGLMAALALVILDDRMRKPIWMATEGGAVPILGEVPHRPRSARYAAEPWYPMAPPGPRKMGVQRVLAGLMGFIESGPGALGVAGLGVTSEDVRELAIDLGASTAMSEHSVLLIDAIGVPDDSDTGGEGGAVTIADLLSLSRSEPETSVSRAKQVLAEATRLAPGIRTLASGDLGAEAVMSPAFAALLEQAKAEYALTVVAAPQADDAFAAALWQRLDGFVAVAEAGRTRISDIAQLSSSLRRRHASLLGAVLLRRSFFEQMLDMVPTRWRHSFSTRAASA